MVHGDAVSDGCLPVGDDAIEELFVLTSRIGTEHVEMIISPLDLRRVEPQAALARLRRPPSWVGDLYAQLAASLRAFPLPPDHEDTTPPPGRRLRVARSRCRPYDVADCTRRCNRGETGSCARAGLLYRDGRGVARDTTKAWSLLSKSCTGGDAFGCGALAELYLDDDGSRRSVARSANLARVACDGGDGHACAHLAELCTDHLSYPGPRAQCTPQQVERLHAQAVALLDGSCDGWAAYDCHTLARIYANDERGGASALRFSSRSCAAGDPGGCDALAQLREDDGDVAGAHELYAQACRNGYARACGRARRLPVRTIVTAR
jgi:TPR repeat protein